mgnify:CR=1 FL=1
MKIRRRMGETKQIVQVNGGNILLFELAFRFLTLPLLLQAVAALFRLSVRASGYSYVTVSNLVSYLLRPVTIAILVLMAAILLVGVSIEAAGLLAAYQAAALSRKMSAFSMFAAGIRLTIVSNNTAKRVRPFAERIGLDWVPLACKPLTIGLAVARRRLGVKKSQMAMVGDQIFADRMAAGLYGCPCLYLLPRAPGDRNKFVQFKRKYEPYWLDRYYKKGGVVHE